MILGKQLKQKDGAVVYPIVDGLFDYFCGEGWKQQSRYRMLRNGLFVYINGTKLTDGLLKTLVFK